MPSLALDDCLIWFAHCPKAGGTSVEQAMLAHWGDRVGHLKWGWDLWWKHGGWRVADPPNSPQHLVWEDAQKVLPRPPDKVFALVRDPATRLQSEHNWQRHHRRGTLIGRLLAALPFSLWLRVLLQMAQQNPYVLDNHMRLQSDFVPAHALIFRLEDGMKPVLNWLEQATGTTTALDIPHALAGRPRQPLMTDAYRARICTVFRADYLRFGYPLCDQAPPEDTPIDWVIRLCATCLVWLDRRGKV